jgi:hypothetical protein
MFRNLIKQIKQHPIAIGIFTLYLIFWIGVGYFTYHYLVKRDADSIENMLYYCFVYVSLPYLAINIPLVWLSKQYGKFYKELCFFIAIPMGIVVLIYVAHDIVGYVNSGM